MRSRIRSSADFKDIYGARRSVRNRHLTVYFRDSTSGVSRLGLSVGRRLGNAVVRNRIKRVLREVFRLRADSLPRALDVVVIPRSPRSATDFHEMSRSFAELSSRIARLLEEGR